MDTMACVEDTCKPEPVTVSTPSIVPPEKKPKPRLEDCKLITVPCVTIKEVLLKRAAQKGLNVSTVVKKKRKYDDSYAIDLWFYGYNDKEKKLKFQKSITARQYLYQLLTQCYRKKASAGKRQGKLFEVEYILDLKYIQGKRYYLIKWADWPLAANTWESCTSLNCQQLIDTFHEDYNTQLHKFMDKEKWANFVKSEAALYKSKVGVNERILLSTPPEFKYLCSYQLKKEKIKLELDLWQEKINDITKGRPYIAVENEVDLETLSPSFTYIMENIAGEGVTIPTDPLIGCECTNCSMVNGKVCGCLPSKRLNYEKCLVKVQPGKPIYECNSRCKCSADCKNRVVQNGSTIAMSIYRTPNDKGWGVKTLQPIPRGAFVIEYVGEVITNKEAEKRGELYDADGITYLFDLDYHETKNPLTVDATNFGNISHFINHSCAPNLQVYNVFVDNMDPSIPRIALFARRNILENEELTFDYQMTGATEEMEESSKCGEGEEYQTEVETDELKRHTDHPTDVVESDENMHNGEIKELEKSKDNGSDVDVETASNKDSNVSGQRIPCFCEAKRCRGWLLS